MLGVVAAIGLVAAIIHANIAISKQSADRAAAEDAAKRVMTYDPGKASFVDGTTGKTK
ncbi:hypothetical protein ACOJBO_03235 [Rhizobium beringeri]